MFEIKRGEKKILEVRLKSDNEIKYKKFNLPSPDELKGKILLISC